MIYFYHFVMKKNILKNSLQMLVPVIFFFLALTLFSNAQTNTSVSGQLFVKNLTLGNENSDVALLKQVLNSNPLTAIQKSGLIEEKSTYFGPDTRRAVIQFQELYKETVLFPSGLSRGTGFVGPSTRAKLNEIAKTLNLQANLEVSGGNNAEIDPLVAKLRALLGIGGAVKVNMAQNYQVSPGGTLILNGSGFTSSGNTVHFSGKYSVSNVASLSGTSLKVDLPQDLPLGRHNVWVTNINGTSRNPQAEVYFVITQNPVANPVITSISPLFVDENSEITINGKGFSRNNNNLYTGLGNVTNIPSSEGDTLKIKISDLPYLAAIASNPELKGTTYSLPVYVQNENGSSLSPFMFKFTLK